MPSVCPGCSRVFTLSGLAKHLALTRNNDCLKAQQLPEWSTPITTAQVDPHIPDLDLPPVPFEGDFFGAYGNNDFPEQHGPVPPVPQPLSLEETDDDDDGDDDDGNNDIPEAYRGGWEPPLPSSPPRSQSTHPRAMYETPAGPRLPSAVEREAAERTAQARTFVVPFPGHTAGAPVPHSKPTSSTYAQYQHDLDEVNPHNIYAPFTSKMDWEVARWAKLRGAGSTSFDDLTQIEGLTEALSLSYRRMRDLNKIVDSLPTGRPAFERHEIVVADEAFEVYTRDIIQCIKSLLGDPEFAPLLLLVPERHYADRDHTTRTYFDMNTGKWWWATQAALEKERKGATVIPVIISSDKTQLTLIGNKTAYPVYMTLGNLPKDIRCKPSRGGQILLAYLPTSRLLHISNKAARRRTLANLFHACMSQVLQPLVKTGVDGMLFACGNGIIRRGHPILATFVGDYPEQLLVTGCKNGECAKCNVARSDLGSSADTSRPLRDIGLVLDALATIDEGPLAFTRACHNVGIKPVQHPFWESLPYTNIFAAITPDLLHQLHQGVVKHLVAWLQSAYGADEIDAHCRRLPLNHSLRHFAKGISTMSRVTGKEHQDISRILLGLVVGLELPGGVSSARLVRATRALLDFLNLAQYACHTSSTLKLLDEALASFHANKQVFVDLGIREHFKLPKLHFLEHYRRSIELFGTTDNYDTQYSERLHIDFTKEAYRASNHKDEFAQMTVWLQRKEKILRHEKYVQWRLVHSPSPGPVSSHPPTPRILASSIPTSSASVGRTPPITMTIAPAGINPDVSRSGVAPDMSGVPTAAHLHQPQAIDSASTRALPGRPRSPVRTQKPRISMTRHPSVKAVRFDHVVCDYGASYFRDALTRFVTEKNSPGMTMQQVELASGGVYFDFAAVPTYHKIKLMLNDSQGLGVTHAEPQDVVHVRPARRGKYDTEVPGRFDTVLIRAHDPEDAHAIRGFRVAQVRIVFKIPQANLISLFPRLDASSRPDGHLAYVEWFTPSSPSAHPNHGLYRFTRLVSRQGARLASIIPIDRIERSCHLLPEFGPIAPRDWSSSDVLERCQSFLLNAFSDRYMYMLVS
ncbi:hypothetical protein C2E23DRAFT_602675 [Lenzites betulinus]|nr:hypothetical protein C2E23DRAFT_602675 [Lenzites betulinus]